MFSGSKYPKLKWLNLQNRSTASNNQLVFSFSWVRCYQSFAELMRTALLIYKHKEGREYLRNEQICTAVTRFILSRDTHSTASGYMYRRTCKYWIALGENASVYRGIQGSTLCPNENFKEQLSFCTLYLASLVIFFLMVSTNCEIKFQTVVIQY